MWQLQHRRIIRTDMLCLKAYYATSAECFHLYQAIDVSSTQLCNWCHFAHILHGVEYFDRNVAQK